MPDFQRLQRIRRAIMQFKEPIKSLLEGRPAHEVRLRQGDQAAADFGTILRTQLQQGTPASRQAQDQPIQHSAILGMASGVVRNARRRHEYIAPYQAVLSALQTVRLAAARQIAKFDCLVVGMEMQARLHTMVFISSHSLNIGDSRKFEIDHAPFLGQKHCRRMFEFVLRGHAGKYTFGANF